MTFNLPPLSSKALATLRRYKGMQSSPLSVSGVKKRGNFKPKKITLRRADYEKDEGNGR